jgi:CheY-like chemotaxis protein
LGGAILFDLLRQFRNGCDVPVIHFFMTHEYTAPTLDEIAVGAYHVWEKESRPRDRQKENWTEAESQLLLFHERLEAKPAILENNVVTRNENSAALDTALTMPGIGKHGKTRQPRVLVIDDEPFATHMLGGLLRRYGYIAAELNDPAKALQMAHRFQPDIVLLDIQMPWKNGHEVAADFAADSFQSQVPIIFISQDTQERHESTDSIPILAKPFSIEDLFAGLKEGIARSASKVSTP